MRFARYSLYACITTFLFSFLFFLHPLPHLSRPTFLPLRYYDLRGLHIRYSPNDPHHDTLIAPTVNRISLH